MLDSLSMIEKETWTFREDRHSDTENDSRDHLETPRNSEWSDAVDVWTTELNEVLNENTPCDRPLLQWNHTASDRRRSDFWLVNWDDGTGKTNRYAWYDTAHYEHTTVLKYIIIIILKKEIDKIRTTN